jgi:hypothetical protein
MTETAWNRVNDRSALLVADYQKILAAPDGERPVASAAVRDSGRTIADLESLLATGDPRWFGDKTVADLVPGRPQ